MTSPAKYLLAVGMLVSGPATSQPNDSTTLLHEVVIERQRIEELALGHFSIKVDSETQVLAASTTTADLMQKFGYGHNRSYGPGGLTTLSLRGTGAGHTSILWNGIPLQSPQNGQSDLSQIPTFFMDDIHLQMGGSTSINGNGAIGGTLHLNSKARFNDGVIVSGFLTGASFGTGVGGLGASWSGNKFTTDTRVFYLDAINDFPYTNTNVTPAQEETRAHAAYNRLGILHRDNWRPAMNWLVQLEGWIQDNYTQLPNPVSVFRESQASQEDDFLRVTVGAQFTPGPLHLSARSAFQRQILDYRDGALNLHALSAFTSSINMLEATWLKPSGWELTAGINSTFESSEADDYDVATVDRARIAGFGAARIASNKLVATISAREEFVDGDLMPFAPSAGAEYAVSSKVKLTGNVSRSYRIPTMNDLYWSGAGAMGNADLLAENSWSEEVAVNIQSSLGGGKLTWKTTAFSNQVNDWILWRYESLTWSPENIKKVWSRGSETQVITSWQLAGVQTSIGCLYSFTRSTNVEVYSPAAVQSVGKQLAFTPVHEGSMTINGEWKNWSLRVSGNMTGKQYTDDDNSESFALDPYASINAWLGRDLGAGKAFRCKIIAEANNILDSSYESRPGYPMPGRNFRLSLNFNIHKPVSK